MFIILTPLTLRVLVGDGDVGVSCFSKCTPAMQHGIAQRRGVRLFVRVPVFGFAKSSLKKKPWLNRPRNGMEYVLALVALIPWMQLCIYVPPIPAIDQMPGSTATPATSRAKAFVVCLCLAMLVFRNLSLAALEVGTAQLAQNKYGFESLAVGLLCAGIVFTSLPVQLLYERLRANKKFRISLHTMLWTGLVAGSLDKFP